MENQNERTGNGNDLNELTEQLKQNSLENPKELIEAGSPPSPLTSGDKEKDTPASPASSELVQEEASLSPPLPKINQEVNVSLSPPLPKRNQELNAPLSPPLPERNQESNVPLSLLLPKRNPELNVPLSPPLPKRNQGANTSLSPPSKDRDSKTTEGSKETDLVDTRSYLKFLQYEIDRKYNSSVLSLTRQVTDQILKNCCEVAVYLSDDDIKIKYINTVSKWIDQIHTEIQKLFSEKVPEDEKGGDSTQSPDLNSVLVDFRDNSTLSHAVILQFLMALLHDGNYSGITRSFINKIRGMFNIRYRDLIEQLELPISQDLLTNQEAMGKIDGEKERQGRHDTGRLSRWAWTSLGAVGGGVALAVSGGLAAPFVLPYMGTLLGTSALLAGTSGVAIVTSIFGATGAGLTGYKISRRTASIKDFAFLPVPTVTKTERKAIPLHATICLSGWLISKDDISEPWSSLEDGDGFAVRFEASTLLEIGNALKSLFATQVVGYAASEVLKKTVMAGLISAIAWPLVLLQAGSVIDNPWSLGLDRADKAGKILADALINRAQGRRPVTLIGFSLGGRAIFSCLQELLARSSEDASVFDIVENVFILGAPVTISRNKWLAIKALVPGRLVNGYSSGDWILSFLHRAYSYGKPVAGNCDLYKVWGSQLPTDSNSPSINSSHSGSLEDEIESPSQEFDLTGAQDLGIESIDFTGIVDGHLDYVKAMPTILDYLGFATAPVRDSEGRPSESVLLFESDL